MILRFFYQRLTLVSKKSSKITASDIPSPPNLQYFGRSRSETIAINAFATVLYERGIDWTQIKTGYRHECFKNPKTGRLLELDAYAPNIKVALEYNGIQHYKFPNPFHNSEKEFQEGVERDNSKRELCKEHGITLIEIPYYIDTCVPDKESIGEWKYKKTTTGDKWKSIKAFIEKAF
jgi:hypothetical protein